METVMEPVREIGVRGGCAERGVGGGVGFPMEAPTRGPLDLSQPQFEGIHATLRLALRRHLRDTNELEDVIGETYLRAVRYQKRLRDPEKIRGWLLQIARNVLADKRRTAKRWVCCSYGEDEDGAGTFLEPEEEVEEEREPLEMGVYRVEEEDAAAILRVEMREMAPPDQALLSAYYGGAESCRETAAELGLPRPLVKIRLFRARRRLCRALRHRLAISHANPGVRAGVSRVPSESAGFPIAGEGGLS